MFLKVIQIYYSKDQKPLLEPQYEPYLNENCTVFFENSVIVEKIMKDRAHSECEYFAVISYKLREKIGAVMKERWKSLPEIANHSSENFRPSAFEAVLKKYKPDVLSFQRHMPHDPVSVANRFHPNFSLLFSKIMEKIGFQYMPEMLNDVFYCNFFAAKSTVYEAYVREMLWPAMLVMEKMPELYENSRYPSTLPTHLQDEWGINYYPYHSFLCERMFSYYAKSRGLNCLHF